MSAKHADHQPKRQRRTSDLERRVRWLERHMRPDCVKTARDVARHEISQAMRELA